MELIIGTIVICLVIWGFNRITHATQNSDINEGCSATVIYCVVVGVLIGLICILAN